MGISRTGVLCLAFVMATASTAAADDHPHVAIVQRVEASPGDRAVAEQALRELDALLEASATDALAHFGRGRVLEALGRKGDAISAYDTAFALDRPLARAAFHAGVLLRERGRPDEAIRHFETAVAADPSFVEAARNLGAILYQRKQYVKALAAYQQARTHRPDDFHIAHAIVRTLHALDRTEEAAKARVAAIAARAASRDPAIGRTREATKARAEVHAVWKASKAPDVRQLTRYLFDMFLVGRWKVLAFDHLVPPPDGTVYTAEVSASETGDPTGTFHVRPGPSRTFVLVFVPKDRPERTFPTRWKRLPDYAAVKAAISAAIERELGPHRSEPAHQGASQ